LSGSTHKQNQRSVVMATAYYRAVNVSEGHLLPPDMDI